MPIPTLPQGLSLPLTYNADAYAIDAIYADGGGNVFADIRNGGTVQLFPAGAATPPQIQSSTFDLPGVSVFVLPPTVTQILVAAAAAGGGGGGNSGGPNFTSGCGGGAGDAIANSYTVIAGETLTITVGAGGAGGALGGSGATGGITSITGSLSGLIFTLAGGGGGGSGSGAGGAPGGTGAQGGSQHDNTVGLNNRPGVGGDNIAGGLGGVCRENTLPLYSVARRGGGGSGGAGAANDIGQSGGNGFVTITYAT